MKNYILILFLLPAFIMYGQGLRNDGAHIVVSNNANIYIDGATGHYTANNTAYITRSGTGNGGTIHLNGD